jgi:RNA polymerase sigma-70 factor, ECF subfamily
VVRRPASSRPLDQDDSVVRAQAAARGDRRMAGELLGELLPRVRNLVRYLARRDRDVDDITQEALVGIVKSLGSYRGDGTLESWADRVVVRTTFAELRKRRAELLLPWLRGVVVDADQRPTGISDEYLLRRWAVSVLDELPLPQRHAVVLHHLLDMTVPEIALELDLPRETVRSRLRLARCRLRERGFGLGYRSFDLENDA